MKVVNRLILAALIVCVVAPLCALGEYWEVASHGLRNLFEVD